MIKEDFRKSKEELEKTKKENDEKIGLYDERTRMANINSFEEKLISTLELSTFGYLSLYIISTGLIKMVGVTAFTNVIPALSYPVLLIGGSLSIGTIINNFIYKKYKIRERYKSFSTAKTIEEKLQEEIYYQIELEKARNRNKAIDEAIKVFESNQEILNTLSRRYDLNDKTAPQTKEEATLKVNELSMKIKEQYNKLDMLTKQKVLHDRFWRIRSKFQKASDILITSIASGFSAMILIGFPLMIVRDAITYSSSFISLASIFAPFATAGIVANIYMLKRNEIHKKVFKNLNLLLGKNDLEETYKKFEGAYEEKQELARLIETQIRNISLAEVQLQENKRYLEKFSIEEDVKSLDLGQSKAKNWDNVMYSEEEIHQYMQMPETSPAPFNFGDSIFEQYASAILNSGIEAQDNVATQEQSSSGLVRKRTRHPKRDKKDEV